MNPSFGRGTVFLVVAVGRYDLIHQIIMIAMRRIDRTPPWLRYQGTRHFPETPLCGGRHGGHPSSTSTGPCGGRSVPMMMMIIVLIVCGKRTTIIRMMMVVRVRTARVLVVRVLTHEIATHTPNHCITRHLTCTNNNSR